MISVEAVEQEINKRKARDSYVEYLKYCYPEYYMTHFHEFLATKIQWCLDNIKDQRWNIVLISCQPRAGKSHLVVEKLPAYVLGKHPRDEVIITGYGSTIAEQFGRTARDNYERTAPMLWSDAKLSASAQGAGHWETALGGKCHSAGLLAPLTGYGANVLIIDDPIKNMAEADSETIIERIHSGLVPDVLSRVYPGGLVFVINTRWVENDLSAFIRENFGEYVIMDLNIPALCEDPATDPLHREKDEAIIGPHMGDDMDKMPSKIRITTQIMRQQRSATIFSNGERYWNALYQGHPSNEDGNIVDVNKFALVSTQDMYINGHKEPGRVPIPPMEYCILSIDCSFTNKENADFVAMGLWGYRQDHHYLMHLVNKRLSFTQTIDKVKELIKTWSEKLIIDEILIENKANGPAVIDVLRQEKDLPPIVETDPSRAGAGANGKVARAKAITPFIERGLVSVAIDSPRADCDQVSKQESLLPHQLFIKQWKQFPYAKHDDIVDMTSQYLARAHKLITGEEIRFERTIQKVTHWNALMWKCYESMTEEEQEEFVKTVGIPEEWVDGD